jgi:hypothetical protein
MINSSEKSCRETQNTYDHFCSVIFFRKSCRLRNNVEKYEKTKQAKDEDITLRRKGAACMPDKYGKNMDTYS